MDHHVVKTVLLDVLGHLHQQEDQAAKDNVRVAVADNALDALELVQVAVANVRAAVLEIVTAHVISIVKIAVVKLVVTVVDRIVLMYVAQDAMDVVEAAGRVATVIMCAKQHVTVHASLHVKVRVLMDVAQHVMVLHKAEMVDVKETELRSRSLLAVWHNLFIRRIKICLLEKYHVVDAKWFVNPLVLEYVREIVLALLLQTCLLQDIRELAFHQPQKLLFEVQILSTIVIVRGDINDC